MKAGITGIKWRFFEKNQKCFTERRDLTDNPHELTNCSNKTGISVQMDRNTQTTARWEQVLDEIASGKANAENFIFDQVDVLQGVLQRLSCKN